MNLSNPHTPAKGFALCTSLDLSLASIKFGIPLQMLLPSALSLALQKLVPLFALCIIHGVNDPTAKAEGLCLSSTATLHIFADVQLWLHRSTHQGVLTRRPYSSSLAGQAAF